MAVIIACQDYGLIECLSQGESPRYSLFFCTRLTNAVPGIAPNMQEHQAI